MCDIVTICYYVRSIGQSTLGQNVSYTKCNATPSSALCGSLLFITFVVFDFCTYLIHICMQCIILKLIGACVCVSVCLFYVCCVLAIAIGIV